MRVGKRLYKDPTTYHAVDDAVQDFANELDISDMCIGQFLGGGEFAEVYRGTLRKNMNKVDVDVKTLRVINFCLMFALLLSCKVSVYDNLPSI